MEFKEWPQIPRMSKEKVYITEKVDGSNSAIRIRPSSGEVDYSQAVAHVVVDDVLYDVWAQSRNRFLNTGKDRDNFGFAGWVFANAHELVKILGPGDHYGEWWGSGIQRGYGLEKGEKRFSLFNAARWIEILHHTEARSEVPNLFIVPTLYTGSLYDMDLAAIRKDLEENGTKIVPNFKAEGMVVYFREIKASYKVLLENDTLHKWQTQ